MILHVFVFEVNKKMKKELAKNETVSEEEITDVELKQKEKMKQLEQYIMQAKDIGSDPFASLNQHHELEHFHERLQMYEDAHKSASQSHKHIHTLHFNTPKPAVYSLRQNFFRPFMKRKGLKARTRNLLATARGLSEEFNGVMPSDLQILASVTPDNICTRFSSANATNKQHATSPEALDNLKHTTILIAAVTNRNMHPVMARHHLFFKRMHEQTRVSTVRNVTIIYFSNDLMKTSRYVTYREEGDIHSTRRTATLRAFLSIWYTAKDCMNLSNLQWFMVIDDDAVVNPLRLAKFLYVVETELGAPTKVPLVLGRDASWTYDQFFGGNGMLFSAAALRSINNAQPWDAIVEDWKQGKYLFLEPMVWAALKQTKLGPNSMIRLATPFGLTTDPCSQDEIQDLLLPYFEAEKENLNIPRLMKDISQITPAPLANVTISLHKVKEAVDFVIAESVFHMRSSLIDYTRIRLQTHHAHQHCGKAHGKQADQPRLSRTDTEANYTKDYYRPKVDRMTVLPTKLTKQEVLNQGKKRKVKRALQKREE